MANAKIISLIDHAAHHTKTEIETEIAIEMVRMEMRLEQQLNDLRERVRKLEEGVTPAPSA